MLGMPDGDGPEEYPPQDDQGIEYGESLANDGTPGAALREVPIEEKEA
jgi:hypothetical protein